MNDVANFLKTFDDFHLARLDSNLALDIVKFSSPAMCLLGHHQDGYGRCIATDAGNWAQHELITCVLPQEEKLFRGWENMTPQELEERAGRLDRLRNEYLQPLVTEEIDYRKAGRIGSFAWKENS